MKEPHVSRPAPLLIAGAAALAALGLSACGSSKPAGAGSTTTSAAAGGGASRQVTVSESEFHLALSTTTFSPGAYTFVAQDTGQVQHALSIKGPGVSASTALISPGQSADLHVTLQAGTYEVWCPVDGHKSLGMDAHFTVSG